MKKTFNEFAHHLQSAYPSDTFWNLKKQLLNFKSSFGFRYHPWIIKEDFEPESEIVSVLAISFLKIEVSNSSFIFRSTMKAFIYFSRRSQQDRAARRVVWLTAVAAPPC